MRSGLRSDDARSMASLVVIAVAMWFLNLVLAWVLAPSVSRALRFRRR
jgi:hypothetical protein